MTRRLTALTFATAAALSADAFTTSSGVGRPAVGTTTTTSSSLEARADGLGEDATGTLMGNVGKAIATAALAMAVFDPSPALADGQTEKFKLPPIDKNDKMRCTFNDSKMGQANAQRDKVSSTERGREAGYSPRTYVYGILKFSSFQLILIFHLTRSSTICVSASSRDRMPLDMISLVSS